MARVRYIFIRVAEVVAIHNDLLTANIFESGPMPTPWKSSNTRVHEVLRIFIFFPPKEIWFPANPGLVLTQLTTWDDWQAVQEFSWGWQSSTFKYISC